MGHVGGCTADSADATWACRDVGGTPNDVHDFTFFDGCQCYLPEHFIAFHGFSFLFHRATQ